MGNEQGQPSADVGPSPGHPERRSSQPASTGASPPRAAVPPSSASAENLAYGNTRSPPRPPAKPPSLNSNSFHGAVVPQIPVSRLQSPPSPHAPHDMLGPEVVDAEDIHFDDARGPSPAPTPPQPGIAYEEEPNENYSDHGRSIGADDRDRQRREADAAAMAMLAAPIRESGSRSGRRKARSRSSSRERSSRSHGRSRSVDKYASRDRLQPSTRDADSDESDEEDGRGSRVRESYSARPSDRARDGRRSSRAHGDRERSSSSKHRSRSASRDPDKHRQHGNHSSRRDRSKSPSSALPHSSSHTRDRERRSSSSRHGRHSSSHEHDRSRRAADDSVGRSRSMEPELMHRDQDAFDVPRGRSHQSHHRSDRHSRHNDDDDEPRSAPAFSATELRARKARQAATMEYSARPSGPDRPLPKRQPLGTHEHRSEAEREWMQFEHQQEVEALLRLAPDEEPARGARSAEWLAEADRSHAERMRERELARAADIDRAVKAEVEAVQRQRELLAANSTPPETGRDVPLETSATALNPVGETAHENAPGPLLPSASAVSGLTTSEIGSMATPAPAPAGQMPRSSTATSKIEVSSTGSALHRASETGMTPMGLEVYSLEDLLRTRPQSGNWQRGDAVKNCSQCSEQFRFYRTKHHCLYCGNLFCKDCLSYAKKFPMVGFIKKPIRVCKACYNATLPEVHDSSAEMDGLRTEVKSLQLQLKAAEKRDVELQHLRISRRTLKEQVESLLKDKERWLQWREILRETEDKREALARALAEEQRKNEDVSAGLEEAHRRVRMAKTTYQAEYAALQAQNTELHRLVEERESAITDLQQYKAQWEQERREKDADYGVEAIMAEQRKLQELKRAYDQLRIDFESETKRAVELKVAYDTEKEDLTNALQVEKSKTNDLRSVIDARSEEIRKLESRVALANLKAIDMEPKSEVEHDRELLVTRLEAAKKQTISLSHELEKANERLRATEKENANLKGRVAALKEVVSEHEVIVHELQEELEKTRHKADAATKREQQSRAKLDKQMAAMLDNKAEAKVVELDSEVMRMLESCQRDLGELVSVQNDHAAGKTPASNDASRSAGSARKSGDKSAKRHQHRKMASLKGMLDAEDSAIIEEDEELSDGEKKGPSKQPQSDRPTYSAAPDEDDLDEMPDDDREEDHRRDGSQSSLPPLEYNVKKRSSVTKEASSSSSDPAAIVKALSLQITALKARSQGEGEELKRALADVYRLQQERDELAKATTTVDADGKSAAETVAGLHIQVAELNRKLKEMEVDKLTSEERALANEEKLQETELSLQSYAENLKHMEEDLKRAERAVEQAHELIKAKDAEIAALKATITSGQQDLDTLRLELADKQGELEAVLQTAATQLHESEEQVKKLTAQIDDTQKQMSEHRTKASSDAEISARATELEAVISSLNAQHADLTKRLDELTAQNNELKAKADDAQSRLAARESQLETLAQELREATMKRREAEQSVDARVKDLTAEIEQLRAANETDTRDAEIEQLRRQLEQAGIERVAIVNEKDQIAAELKGAGRREKKLHTELEECQKLLVSLSAELETTTQEKSELVHKYEEDIAKLRELNKQSTDKLSAKIKELEETILQGGAGQLLQHARRDSDSLTAQLMASQFQLNSLQKQRDEASAMAKDLTAKLADKDRQVEESQTTAERNRAEWQAKLDSIAEQRDDIERERSLLITQVNSLRSHQYANEEKLHIAIDRMIKDLQEQVRTLRKECDGYSAALRSKESELKDQMTKMEATIASLKEQVASLEQTVAKLRAQIESLQQALAKAENSSAEATQLRELLAKTQEELKAKESELADRTQEWTLQEAKLRQAKEFLENRAAVMAQTIASLTENMERMESRCLELAQQLAEQKAARDSACSDIASRAFSESGTSTDSDSKTLTPSKSTDSVGSTRSAASTPASQQARPPFRSQSAAGALQSPAPGSGHSRPGSTASSGANKDRWRF